MIAGNGRLLNVEYHELLDRIVYNHNIIHYSII